MAIYPIPELELDRKLEIKLEIKLDRKLELKLDRKLEPNSNSIYHL